MLNINQIIDIINYCNDIIKKKLFLSFVNSNYSLKNKILEYYEFDKKTGNIKLKTKIKILNTIVISYKLTNVIKKYTIKNVITRQEFGHDSIIYYYDMKTKNIEKEYYSLKYLNKNIDKVTIIELDICDSYSAKINTDFSKYKNLKSLYITCSNPIKITDNINVKENKLNIVLNNNYLDNLTTNELVNLIDINKNKVFINNFFTKNVFSKTLIMDNYNIKNLYIQSYLKNVIFLKNKIENLIFDTIYFGEKEEHFIDKINDSSPENVIFNLGFHSTVLETLKSFSIFISKIKLLINKNVKIFMRSQNDDIRIY